MKIDVRGKTIAVVGLARSGLAVAEYASKQAKKIILADQNESLTLPAKFHGKNFEIMLGKNYLDALKKSDIAFITPGINRSKLKHARAKLYSEIELLFDKIENETIGVTGSNGKSTVCALISHIFTKAGLPNVLGGNIGNALIDDLPKIKKNDLVIIELSSYQLEFLDKSPNIAVVVNVSPNHLDRHGSLAKYISAKSNILTHQGPKDIAILNAEDSDVLTLAKKVRGRKIFFNIAKPIDDSYYLKAGMIVFTDGESEQEICSTAGWQLLGKHNLSNLLAAVAVAHLRGVSRTKLESAIKSFVGLEHRIEPAGSKRGVSYFNDSKATTPESTVAAMNSFGKKIILICGGADKDLEFFPLVQNIPRQAKKLILMSETGRRIKKELTKHFPEYDDNIIECFDDDLSVCVRNAQKASISGDVILFSPAAASMDRYLDFQERGEAFKKIVKEL